MQVVVEKLNVHRDSRGMVVEPLDGERLGTQRNVHVVFSQPGEIRGNHYHPRSNEVLIVQHRDDWLFAWKENGENVSSRCFSGEGAILFWLPAGLAHAVKNTGSQSLEIISCSNERPGKKDTCWVTILE